MRYLITVGTALAVLMFGRSVQADPSAGNVTLALVLAVDVSASINPERFEFQRQGYVNAFRHPAVIEAIRMTPRGRIAVTLVEWASTHSQRVVVPWMVISDAEGGAVFANRLRDAPRSFDGLTAIGSVIDFSVGLLNRDYPRGGRASRVVIDISADGVNNDGGPPQAARDAALTRDDLTINGLVIMQDSPMPANQVRREPSLDEYFRENVIGGPGTFVIATDEYDSFAYAIVGKMVREISGLPPERAFAGLVPDERR